MKLSDEFFEKAIFHESLRNCFTDDPTENKLNELFYELLQISSVAYKLLKVL